MLEIGLILSLETIGWTFSFRGPCQQGSMGNICEMNRLHANFGLACF